MLRLFLCQGTVVSASMTCLEHKKYGSLGSEFIIHHCTIKPKRLVTAMVVTLTLSFAFKLYEMDVKLLWLLSLLLAVILVFRLLNKVSKEVLLVCPSMGVQVKTQYWLGGLDTQFFDKARVKGIVIAEAVTMQSVLCYLAILLSSSASGQVEQVFPLFTRSWPSLKDLVYVYQAVQNMDSEQASSSLRPLCTENPAAQSCPHPQKDTALHGSLILQEDALDHSLLQSHSSQSTMQKSDAGHTSGPRRSLRLRSEAASGRNKLSSSLHF